MKIRVEHAACGETFNHAHLLNPEQNQRRPYVIEKLDSDEQNPERNFVSLALNRERNAVMSNKHFRLVVGLSPRRTPALIFGV